MKGKEEEEWDPSQLTVTYDDSYFEGVDFCSSDDEAGYDDATWEVLHQEADQTHSEASGQDECPQYHQWNLTGTADRCIAGGPPARSSTIKRVFHRSSLERTSPTSPSTANAPSTVISLDSAAAFLFGSGNINEDTRKGDYVDTGCVFHSAAVGDAQKLNFFLSKTRLVLEANDFGYSCLHFAAAYGRRKAVEILLKGGADPNIVNRKNDVTPLHLACAFGHADCVRTLLHHGADYRLLTTRLISPLELAMERNHTECVNLLLKKGARLTWNCERILGVTFDCWKFHLILAIINRMRRVVDYLLDDQLVSDPNFTLLMRPFLPVLREFGFVQDSGQWLKQSIAPLQLAVVQNAKPIVRSLLAHGGDVESSNVESVRTPLQLAVTRADPAMVNLLLRHGADPNQKNVNNQTALQLVIGSPTVVRRFYKTLSLLEYGAEPTGRLRVTTKSARTGSKVKRLNRQALMTQKLLTLYASMRPSFEHISKCRKLFVTKMKIRNELLEILKTVDPEMPRKLLVSRMARAAARLKSDKSLSAVKSAISSVLSFADNDSDDTSVSSETSSDEADDEGSFRRGVEDLSISTGVTRYSGRMTSHRDSGEQEQLFGYAEREIGVDVPNIPSVSTDGGSKRSKDVSSKLVPVAETLLEKPRVHSVVIHRPYSTQSFSSAHDYLNWVGEETAPVKLGLTPWRLRLLKAIRANCYRCVSAIFRRHDVNLADASRDSPDKARQFGGLHLAAKQGNPFIIDLLLKHGAPINAKDSTGNTPLHYAVREMQPSAIRLLVKRKADIYARNDELYSPLGMAALLDLVAHVEEANAIRPKRYGMEGCRETVIAVLNRKRHATNRQTVEFISNATKMNPKAFFKYVSASFPNLDNPLYHGFTLLHYMVFVIPFRPDFPQKLGILLELGANPNVQDLRGNTPLHYAMERECILVLLHYGARWDVKNQQGKTPMETAAGEINYSVYEEFPVASSLKALMMELQEIQEEQEELKKEIGALKDGKTRRKSSRKSSTRSSVEVEKLLPTVKEKKKKRPSEEDVSSKKESETPIQQPANKASSQSLQSRQGSIRTISNESLTRSSTSAKSLNPKRRHSTSDLQIPKKVKEDEARRASTNSVPSSADSRTVFGTTPMIAEFKKKLRGSSSSADHSKGSSDTTTAVVVTTPKRVHQFASSSEGSTTSVDAKMVVSRTTSKTSTSASSQKAEEVVKSVSGKVKSLVEADRRRQSEGLSTPVKRESQPERETTPRSQSELLKSAESSRVSEAGGAKKKSDNSPGYGNKKDDEDGKQKSGSKPMEPSSGANKSAGEESKQKAGSNSAAAVPRIMATGSRGRSKSDMTPPRLLSAITASKRRSASAMRPPIHRPDLMIDEYESASSNESMHHPYDIILSASNEETTPGGGKRNYSLGGSKRGLRSQEFNTPTMASTESMAVSIKGARTLTEDDSSSSYSSRSYMKRKLRSASKD